MLRKKLTNLIQKLKPLKHFVNKDNLKTYTKVFWDQVVRITSFTLILVIFLFISLLKKISKWEFLPNRIREKIKVKAEIFNEVLISKVQTDKKSINRVNIISLAIKNMGVKITRTIITVGGMSIGIASIIFLVSIGYGLQKLVTKRVARLEEMRQAEVITHPGSSVVLNKENIEKIANVKNVEHAIPMVSLVGKISYKNSKLDVAVYAVTKNYLDQSALKPVSGKVFESNEISFNEFYEKPSVAGITNVNSELFGRVIGDIEFFLAPNKWYALREEPSKESKISGYTKKVYGQQTGNKVWGSCEILEDDKCKAYWIKATVPIWESVDNRYQKVMYKEYNSQMQKNGFIYAEDIKFKDINIINPNVLGISDESDQEDTTSVETGLEETSVEEEIVQLEDGWVYIESEVSEEQKEKINTVELSPNSYKQVLVNKAVLQILGIEPNKAIGETLVTKFIATSDLISTTDEKIESEDTEYLIVGVLPGDDTPQIYVPLIDVQSMGITNYSQVKIVVKNKDDLSTVRQEIEALGFSTSSVVDTVERINDLFNTIRLVLALIGTVALGVSALGMFNTLTVSLLERTREIGLMKAMGMKSHEVKELMLTESMVMGFFGGVTGIVIGAIFGKLLSFVLSTISILKGVGPINITYIPPVFILFIIILSLIVGFTTGIYPSKRATKISALNALRYE